MKKKEKIIGIREQSNQRLVRERFWYFNEETVNSISPIQKNEDSEKLDSYKKIIRGKNDHLVPKAIRRNRFKQECSFVVDWQLSDSL